MQVQKNIRAAGVFLIIMGTLIGAVGQCANMYVAELVTRPEFVSTASTLVYGMLTAYASCCIAAGIVLFFIGAQVRTRWLIVAVFGLTIATASAVAISTPAIALAWVWWLVVTLLTGVAMTCVGGFQYDHCRRSVFFPDPS